MFRSSIRKLSRSVFCGLSEEDVFGKLFSVITSAVLGSVLGGAIAESAKSCEEEVEDTATEDSFVRLERRRLLLTLGVSVGVLIELVGSSNNEGSFIESIEILRLRLIFSVILIELAVFFPLVEYNIAVAARSAVRQPE